MKKMSNEQRETESREFIEDISDILLEEIGVNINVKNITSEGCLAVTGRILNSSYFQMHRHDEEGLIWWQKNIQDFKN